MSLARCEIELGIERMNQQVANSARMENGNRLPTGRLLLAAVALMVAVSCGCSRIRLPAIDPTGRCLFAPKNTKTRFDFPGMECLDNLGDKVHAKVGKLGKCKNKDGPTFVFPDPAFPEPATPPPCPTPAPKSAGNCNEPCVPSPPCNGACKDGPPAVLLGKEIDNLNRRKRCKLPRKGKRGCILLSPQKIVAPVGGEVVLLSGICGTDGYLQMNQKLEWMLTPDSVGTFIQVGDDDPGLLHRLAGSRQRPEKFDPSYARGITSTKRTLITRGNKDPRDDVQLEKGQTWITISSPSEGTSRVTVLAPDSECWDQRKATATIYWVDARWQFPSPQIVPAGQPVELTTRVTRSEGTLPARGWKVRYEILQPELATFAGTSGASVVEATVDDSGNATVQLVPNQGTGGTATIDMQVIRPGGESDNIPTLTLGRGQTFVTWSSPQLALRAGAPPVASFDVPVQVVANVSNPGDQTATNVVVTAQIPPGARVTSADSFARVLPNSVTWEIGSIPAQQQLDLFMQVAAQSPINLTFTARGDGLVAEDTVRIDVFRPSLTMRAAPVQERVEAGERATFNVDVTNTGDRPLQNLAVTARGEAGIIHEGGGSVIGNRKEDGPLQPGQTWQAQVVFIPTEAGRRCVNFEATADGGQRTSTQGCVLAINPVPQLPALTAELFSPNNRIATGASTFARTTVQNNGQGAANNVKVTMVYDRALQLVEATQGADTSRVGQNIVTWTLPKIEPGQEVQLEGVFTGVAANPRARVAITAESGEGATVNRDLFLEVFQGSAPQTQPRSPTLPPAGPAPQIPGGAAPLQGAPPSQPAPSAPAAPARSGQLQARLIARDNPVRVNDSIRYALQIVNDSDQRDGQVLVQFPLPDGVTVRVRELTDDPRRSQLDINAGVVTLAEIPTLNPDEVVEYELILISNQPQTFNLDVLIRSLRQPDGLRRSVQTTVIP